MTITTRTLTLKLDVSTLTDAQVEDLTSALLAQTEDTGARHLATNAAGMRFTVMATIHWLQGSRVGSQQLPQFTIECNSPKEAHSLASRILPSYRPAVWHTGTFGDGEGHTWDLDSGRRLTYSGEDV